MVVDCTALPETLVESVLFGHEKGSFTGADRPQDGLVKQAHCGTLFLDEIGELPPSFKRSFLRVLQEHRFRPVGAKHELTSNFRVISATNRNLDEMIGEGAFRADLLFRLRTLTIDLPRLTERKEDIKELAMCHMARVCERYQIGTKGFSPDFLDALLAYDWPGNVRELVNAIERSITAAYHGPTLFPKHLPTDIRIKVARSAIRKESRRPAASDASLHLLAEYRQTSERQYLQDLMFQTKGNIKDACLISGFPVPGSTPCSRSTISRQTPDAVTDTGCGSWFPHHRTTFSLSNLTRPPAADLFRHVFVCPVSRTGSCQKRETAMHCRVACFRVVS